eukprot:m.42323 g.42323  ORF g.42323 m.42323 type:complete len:792 (+) comp7052_c2_seq1:61-2436(+)
MNLMSLVWLVWLSVVIGVFNSDGVAVCVGDVGVSNATVNAEDLSIGGRGFVDTEALYNRLPFAAEHVVRDAVWDLSLQPAGFYIRFITNASSLSYSITLNEPSTLGMWHFPPSGESGIDLYCWDESSGLWRWVSTDVPESLATTTFFSLSHLTNGSIVRKFKLHLPTYHSTNSISFTYSNSDQSILTADPSFNPTSPIVWYGTSVQQGAVASRPGQATSNIVARKIDREMLNFGFSGNGVMELSVAKFLVAIPASIFIIDCDLNMNASLITQRIQPLVKFIRENGHPNTAIVLSEHTTIGQEWFDESIRNYSLSMRKALRAGYDDLSKDDANIYYLSGEQFYNNAMDNFTDPTVGGVHPSDLGTVAVADVWLEFLQDIIPKTPNEPFSPVNFTKFAQEVAYPTSVSAAIKEEKMTASLENSFGSIDHHFECIEEDVGLDRVTKDFKDLSLFGRMFNDTGSLYYSRLPSVAQTQVRSAVWELSLMSTNMHIRFVTNASIATIDWGILHPNSYLWHMPPSSCSGIDLFSYDYATALWRRIGVPTTFNSNNTWTVQLQTPTIATPFHTYILYFPIRNTITYGSVSVANGFGLYPGGVSQDAAPIFANPPIVWYGTSIQQGGAASRPGHIYDAFISRGLNRHSANFGFAGNGEEEINVAQYIALLDACVIVIDCLPNMDTDEVAERTVPLVQYFRSHGHPHTPIVLPEGTPSAQYHAFSEDISSLLEKNRALKSAYDKLLANGDTNLHYISANVLLPNPLENPTVGGVHPSDLGQKEIADNYIPILKTIIESSLK